MRTGFKVKGGYVAILTHVSFWKMRFPIGLLANRGPGYHPSKMGHGSRLLFGSLGSVLSRRSELLINDLRSYILTLQN